MSATNNANLTPEEKLALFQAQMEGTFEDVETLPEFMTFPAGTYLLGLSVKIDSEKGLVRITAHNKGCQEKSDPNSEDVPEDALTSFSYNGPFGLAKMKQQWAQVYTHLNTNKISEFLDQLGNVQVLATLKTRADANDATKLYQDLVSVIPA